MCGSLVMKETIISYKSWQVYSILENWFLVQYEDDPVIRVLNEREVKHLDPDDNEEMQEGETVMAFWSADREFYEAAIIKISGSLG